MGIRGECTGGNTHIISDPMYESMLIALIDAGNLLLTCEHDSDTVPCGLCRSTWKAVVQSAIALQEGKLELKKVELGRTSED